MRPRVLYLTAAILALSTVASAQMSVVVPTGYDTKPGEMRLGAPSQGVGFLSYYSSSILGIPDRAVLREVAFRPRNSTHSGNGKRSFDVWLGYPHPRLVAARMSRDRSKIVLGGQAGLQHVAKSVVVLLPPWTPAGTTAPFLVKIPIQPFVFSKGAGGLIVEMRARQSGPVNVGYSMDAMSKASDAKGVVIQELRNACRGSSGFTPFLQSADDASWVPGGRGALFMQAFSTTTALLFFGSMRTAPYPIPLNAYGMPGCRLFTSLDLVMPVSLKPYLRYSKGVSVLPLPASATLAGVTLRAQALEVDPGANARGLTTSSAIEITLGTAGTRAYSARTIYRYYPHQAERVHSAELAPVLRFTY